jgi:cobalt-zinc-cadmium efflux system membrane fusion protein
MKTFPYMISVLLAVMTAGCQRAAKQEPAAEPTVTDEKISFPANSPQLTSLVVQTAGPRELAVTHLTGRLYWSEDTTVRVFTPFGGRIRKIFAQMGDVLEKNAPLAEVESSDFGQAQADARRAASDLQLARRNLARQRDLLAHGATAQKDVEAAEADEARAGSEQARALARLTVYGANADQVDGIFTLKTPIAGTIVERNVNPGQEIRPDQMLANVPQFTAPLFVVSDPAGLWLQLDVSESDISVLERGQQLRVVSRAYPGRIFEGRLENVGDSLDPATRAVKVRGTVDNTERLLKAEMYVTVDVVAGTQKTDRTQVEIPAKAVFMNPRDNQYYVFIERSPGQFERKLVKTGGENDGQTLILEGVIIGQRVVTDGCLLLEAMLESTDKS